MKIANEWKEWLQDTALNKHTRFSRDNINKQTLRPFKSTFNVFFL
jgi:hypothetical protein